MRRAKIACTLGPAVNTIDHLVQLINAGMNVTRLDISHEDYGEHKGHLSAVCRAARIADRIMGVLADLQGPEIRFNRFANDQKHYSERGDRFTITIEDIPGTEERCPTAFKGLPGGVRPGDQILVDDGKVGLRALGVSPTKVLCEVVVAGPVSSNKGVNLPGVAMSIPTMSEKDERDLRQALSKDIDMVALSFVHSGDDVKRVHEIVEEGGRRISVITELEKPQAIANLQEIVNAFDTFMVTHGDLGVGLPLRDMPLVQKQIIRAAREQARPVIVAIQALESMISSPRSTRVEASDVASTILDGADDMMLSGETSVSDYPVETVQAMARIVEATEHNDHAEIHAIGWSPRTTRGVLAHAAVEVTRRVDTRYLVTFTKPGDTTRWLSRLRPSIPLLVFTPGAATRQAMTLTWGTEAHITPDFTVREQMVEAVDVFLRERGAIEVGKRIVILSGSPVGVPGKTNSLRVHKTKAEGETDT